MSQIRVLRLYIKYLGVVRGLLILTAKQIGAGSWAGRRLQRAADRLSARQSWSTAVRAEWRTAGEKQGACLRIPGCQHPLQMRPGSMDHRSFEHIFLRGAYDVRLPARRVLNILDAGANVGLASLYFAGRYPGARIIAVEPDAENFRQLVRNTAGFSSISSIEGALWSHSTRVRIDNPDAASWSFQVSEGGTKSEGNGGIEALGVQDLMDRYGFTGLDIVKLDVEGAEKQILSVDSDRWLGRTRMMICELHDRHVNGCSDAFRAAMARNDFDVIYHDENAIGINRRLRFDA